MSKDIEKQHHQTFENLKKLNNDKIEFWFARELQTALDYSSWDKFKRVLQKAMKACENSEQVADDHFFQVVKMVELGSGSKREIEDYALSRYACYLIVQNADPSKPVIANGQTYFAIQTRRQELAASPNDECSVMSDELGNNSALMTHNLAFAASAWELRMNKNRHRCSDECLMMSYKLGNNSAFITHNSALGAGVWEPRMNTDRHGCNDECLVMSDKLKSNSAFITHNSAVATGGRVQR